MVCVNLLVTVYIVSGVRIAMSKYFEVTKGHIYKTKCSSSTVITAREHVPLMNGGSVDKSWNVEMYAYPYHISSKSYLYTSS